MKKTYLQLKKYLLQKIIISHRSIQIRTFLFSVICLTMTTTKTSDQNSNIEYNGWRLPAQYQQIKNHQRRLPYNSGFQESWQHDLKNNHTKHPYPALFTESVLIHSWINEETKERGYIQRYQNCIVVTINRSNPT